MDATKAALNEALNSENTDAIRVEASVTVKAEGDSNEISQTIKDVLGTFSTSFATSGVPFHKTLRWVQERSTDMC